MRPFDKNETRAPVVILLLSIFMAVPALAEEIKIGGSIAVGFGQANLESEGETSSVDGVGEAAINFSAEKGPFSVQVEIGIADTAESLDIAEHELVWSPTEPLSITISGFSFGVESADGHISVVNAPGGPVGDEEVFFDYSDAGLLNIEFDTSTLVLGIAVSDGCVPECGYGLDSAADEPLAPDTELMTLVLHARGEAGPLAYNVYAANSSGTFSSAAVPQEGTGSGLGFGLVFESEAFGVALDYSAATVECAADAGDTVCSEDLQQTKSGVALTAAGFGMHYFMGKDEIGTATVETTNIDMVYLFDVGEATVGPEYRVITTKESGAGGVSDSFALFGMSLEF